MKKGILHFLSLLLMAVVMVGCFDSSNPDVEIEEVSLNQITASIREGSPTGTLLQERFTLGGMGGSHVPHIVLTGVGSEDFSVNVVLGGLDQNHNTVYRGNIELLHTLAGKGGSTYHLTATASLNGQSVTAPVTIHIVSEHENQAPVAKIDMDENAVSISIDEGASRRLTSDYSSDEDDGIVYCKWTDGARVLSEKTFSPSVGEIVSATGCEVDLSGLSSGNYTFTLMVRDKAGLSDTNSASIVVKAEPLVHDPYLSGTPTPSLPWGDAYLFTPSNGGGTATFTITNKPSWASFDTTMGVLSGVPTVSDIGVYHDINISASNAGGSSHLPPFDIEVTKRTPPSIASGAAKNLSMEKFDFPFADDTRWRGMLRQVSLVTEYGGAAVVLDAGDDYSVGVGLFTLNIKTSPKVQLHLPILGGGEVRFQARGYFDSSILLDIVGDGTYGVKVHIDANTQNSPISEENFDAAKVDITLLNQLKFSDSSLDVSKFTLQGVPSGVGIGSIVYQSDTTAQLTLVFDGSDFSEDGDMAIMIDSEELNINYPLLSNNIAFQAVSAPREPYLFSWDDGVHGIEPWVSDGSVSGTKLLKDINHDSNSSNPSFGLWEESVDGITYFAATGTSSSYFDTELWKTDGTTDGTTIAVDLAQAEGHGSHPRGMSKIGKDIYFFALTGATSANNNFEGDTGLWRLDTSSDSVSLIENFGDFSKNSFHAPGYLKAISNQLFFQKDYDAGNGPNWNPWVSDGLNPAVAFKDAFVGANVGFTLYDVLFKGSYYGVGNDGEHGSELWTSDTTGVGTSIFKDIVLGARRGSYPSNLRVVGDDKLFFTATNAYADGETQAYDKSLWVSNGTASGTIMIEDDTATPSLSRNRFTNLVAMKDKLYFIFLDVDSVGNEIGIGKLWVSEGTSATTKQVSDMNISSDFLIARDAELLFWKADSGLWKSDGSALGMQEVKSFTSSVYAREFVLKSGLLYFKVEDYALGKKQLWRSDGTSAGTFMLLEKNLELG